MTAFVPETRWATISPCGRYRYALGRFWALPLVELACWIMLNPSTADGSEDDPTIRRCRSFSQRLGADGMVIVNLFAYRTPDPHDLLDTAQAGCDPIGPENDKTIVSVASLASWVIAAWGAHGGLMDRDRIVTDLVSGVRSTMWRLGATTKHGQPRHPLYLSADTPLEVHS